jgi:hypothetical protein
VKLAEMTIVASLAWTGCSTAGPAAPVPIETGKTFSLKIGEMAQAADGVLRVGFDGVTADSRCPKGEQCVWAGEANVRVWLQQGAGPRELRELHLAPGKQQATRLRGQELRLVGLAPHPVSGKVIPQADYLATLNLSPGAAADPER